MGGGDRVMPVKRKYHGDSRGSRLYRIWLNMKHRCGYEKHGSYCDYGGRGIKVCDEWINNYPRFKKWALNNGYEDGLSIDRVDNDGNYEPGNCRWATLREQANNTRKNVFVEYKGEIHTLAEWAEIKDIPYHTIITRHRRGWDIEKMLSTKAKKYSPKGTFDANEYYHKNKVRINARRKALRDRKKVVKNEV